MYFIYIPLLSFRKCLLSIGVTNTWWTTPVDSNCTRDVFPALSRPKNALINNQWLYGYLLSKSLSDEIVTKCKNTRFVKNMSSPAGLSSCKVRGNGATTKPSQETWNSKCQTYFDVQATLFGNFWLFTILDNTRLTSIFYKLWLWLWRCVLTQCMVQWCRPSIAPRRRRVEAGDEITCQFM